MSRLEVTKLRHRTFSEHTIHDAKAPNGRSFYIEYLGGGSHLVHGIGYSHKKYIHCLQEQAKLTVAQPNQPIALFEITMATEVVETINVDGKIRFDMQQTVNVLKANHIWGINTLEK